MTTFPSQAAAPDSGFLVAELPAAAAEARSKYLAQGFLLFVGLVFLIGTFIILRWSSQAMEQQSVLWQSRLGLAAQADAEHVSGQITTRIANWRKLVGSDSIRLYTQQAMDGSGPSQTAARLYLENALKLAAEREGLVTPASANLPVNLPSVRGPGIELVRPGGARVLRFGQSQPQPTQTAPRTMLADGGILTGPYADPLNGEVYLSLSMPILPVQSDALNPEAVAVLNATYALKESFLRPSSIDYGPNISGRAVLVSGDATALLMRNETGRGLIIEDVTGFGGGQVFQWASAAREGFARAADSEGVVQLASAVPVAGMDWVAVRLVSEEGALADIKRQSWIWILISLLALALGCGLILFAWRRGIEHRARSVAATRFQATEALNTANHFLLTLADTQPNAVFVEDGDGIISFANHAAISLAGAHERNALEGKTLEAIFGPESARVLIRAADTARATRQNVVAAIDLAAAGENYHGRVSAARLGNDDEEARVVITFDDLTALVEARQKRETTLKQLVGVLTGLIDARDPHSAAQSRLLVRLTRHVGIALNYDEDQLRCVDLAALLMNAGKILVPRSLLAKPEALSDAELQTVRTAMARTADLLDDVDFDGPVLGVIDAAEGNACEEEQVRHQGEVLRLCNAFIGMTSPRAHRAAMPVETALETLRGEGYDAGVFAALSHVVRNMWDAQNAA